MLKKAMLAIFLIFYALIIPEVIYADTQSLVVQSDDSWKVTKKNEPGWNLISHNDDLWESTIAPSRGRCGENRSEDWFPADPMWKKNGISLETAYFRKSFYVKNNVKQAFLWVVFDDDGDVYINDQLVHSDKDKRIDVRHIIFNVEGYLKTGNNLIALEARDVNGGCQSAHIALWVEYGDGSSLLGVPEFKQTDARWANLLYDSSNEQAIPCGTTIKDCGCAMTALAMLLKYYGVAKSPDGNPTNPETVNEYFKKDQQCSQGGCVSRGYAFGNVKWTGVNSYSKEAHDVFGTQKIQFVGASAFKQSDVLREIDDGRPTLLQTADFSHWLITAGNNNNEILIHDPYFNISSLSDARYQNRAAAVRKFRVVNSDFSGIELYVFAGVSFRIEDELGGYAAYDAGTDTFENSIAQLSRVEEGFVRNPEFAEEGIDDELGAIQQVYIENPQSQNFTISFGKSTFGYSAGIVASDKDAQEVIKLYDYEANVLPSEKVLIKFNHDDVSSSEIEKIPEESTDMRDIVESVDLKPYDPSNTLDCPLRDIPLPVAIFSTNKTNVDQIDIGSIRFGSATRISEYKNLKLDTYKDISGDGVKDFITYFSPIQAGLKCGDNSLLIEWSSNAGTRFEKVVPIQFRHQNACISR